jgi:serine/threonine-protein kinase
VLPTALPFAPLGEACERVVERDERCGIINEGHALVADFGIARALHAEGQAITRAGLAIGTRHYTSPEQSTGDKAVDAQTDIYALGAVIYEMLTGEPPFTGRSPQAVVARGLTELPRPRAATREGLPRGLEDVVSKSLARNAVHRYPTATAMAESLAMAEAGSHATSRQSTVAAGIRRSAVLWLSVGLVALLAIGAVVAWATGWGTRSSRSMAASNGGTHVAVLPFQNQGDGANDYIVDGIAGEVRGKLS